MSTLVDKDFPRAEDKHLNPEDFGLDALKWEVIVGNPTSIADGQTVLDPENVLVYKIRNKETGVIEWELQHHHAVQQLASQLNEVKPDRIQVPKVKIAPPGKH